jgi:phosphate transport system ATP-binding protein
MSLIETERDPHGPIVASSTGPVLSTRGLTVGYEGSVVLRDVTLAIPRNRITALIGPSGCGKSTLLRCFNRMNDLTPGSWMTGEVRFEGRDLNASEIDPAALRQLRRRIGTVFQRPNPFPKSVYQNVAWGARINGYRGDLDELVERSLRRATLWDEVKDKLQVSGLKLSVGQQQRLCIARTLAVEPEVLLMDEPCSALDPIATARVEDLINELKAEHTIVLVTHDLQQVRRVSDQAACLVFEATTGGQSLRTGVISESGPTGRLFASPRDPRTEDYIRARTAEALLRESEARTRQIAAPGPRPGRGDRVAPVPARRDPPRGIRAGRGRGRRRGRGLRLRLAGGAGRRRRRRGAVARDPGAVPGRRPPPARFDPRGHRRR